VLYNVTSGDTRAGVTRCVDILPAGNNSRDISEPPEPFEPSEPPEPPDESDDPETDEEHPLPQPERHSERAAARERPDYRALAGYAALREEDTLRQRCCYITLKASHFVSKHDVPKTYRAARYGSKWEDWKPAFEKQMREFDQRHVWDLIYLRKGAQILPGKWVLDQKFDSDGKWVRNRARWVVCGNFESWQYQDLYAAVANNTSVKVFLLITAILDLECEQIDVVTAFLNASLEEEDEIYVAQPDGFDDGTGRVCRLLQALYGLRKAPLLWFRALSTILRKIGFESLSSDLCIFKHRTEMILLIIYVDDMLISAPTKALIASIREALKKHFELKELGDVKQFLPRH
jgi:hypothetical protein